MDRSAFTCQILNASTSAPRENTSLNSMNEQWHKEDWCSDRVNTASMFLKQAAENKKTVTGNKILIIIFSGLFTT